LSGFWQGTNLDLDCGRSRSAKSRLYLESLAAVVISGDRSQRSLNAILSPFRGAEKNLIGRC
jgi:hypothetical protein